MPQKCTGYKTIPDPAGVSAYNLVALLPFRELEERHGKVLILVDDSIVPLQLRRCSLKVVNNLHS